MHYVAINSQHEHFAKIVPEELRRNWEDKKVLDKIWFITSDEQIGLADSTYRDKLIGNIDLADDYLIQNCRNDAVILHYMRSVSAWFTCIPLSENIIAVLANMTQVKGKLF